MTHAIRQAAHQARDSFLTILRNLVDLESPTSDKEAADKLSEHLETLLRGSGWAVKRYPQTSVGDHLVARLDGPGDGGTLILAHYDTVWPVSTLDDMPFRIDGDKVYGPGVLDMKAGIANAITAVELVRQLNLDLRGPLTLLITSDEETGSHSSRQLIETLCQGKERVLVVEPGMPDGGLKIQRKGIGYFTVHFKGISAHAGNNPQEGASALRELANFLLFAESLTDYDRGTTVNVTLAQGGTVGNAIAESAEAGVDFRVLTQHEAERVVEQIRSYQPRDERVQVCMEGGLDRPPMELTPANKALVDEALAIAATMGITLTGALAGGGSDGNITSALGAPTLDGLGSVGFGPHMRIEHIDLPATLDRVALLVQLISSQSS